MENCRRTWREHIVFLSRRLMLLSRLRSGAANSRVWTSLWGRRWDRLLWVGARVAVATMRSRCTRRWEWLWRIWSLPTWLSKGPDRKAAEMRWLGNGCRPGNQELV